MQISVFRPSVVQHARQQIKGRTDPQLIQKGILTEIGGTYLDRIIACTSPNAKYTKPDQAKPYQTRNTSLQAREWTGSRQATVTEIPAKNKAMDK